MERLLQIYEYSKVAINNDDVYDYLRHSPADIGIIPQGKTR